MAAILIVADGPKSIEYRKSARTSRKIYPQNRICKVGGRLLCTDRDFPSEKS